MESIERRGECRERWPEVELEEEEHRKKSGK
jgi:hypothetical protein